MAGAPLVVVSNHGPLSFRTGPGGDLAPGGTGGGLAGALRSLLPGMGCTWVSCAMSSADREAAARGLMTVDGIELRMVEPSPDVYRMAYDVVSNATLWFPSTTSSTRPAVPVRQSLERGMGRLCRLQRPFARR